MRNIAILNESGTISSIVYPNPNAEYIEGETLENGYTARLLPEGVNTTAALETYYWHDDQWKTDKTPWPGNYHYWEDAQWKINLDDLWKEVRNQRRNHIVSCDWTQAADSPLSDSKKAEWATYRQALRDVPSNNSDVTSLDAVTWPTEPA